MVDTKNQYQRRAKSLVPRPEQRHTKSSISPPDLGSGKKVDQEM